MKFISFGGTVIFKSIISYVEFFLHKWIGFEPEVIELGQAKLIKVEKEIRFSLRDVF